MNNRNCNCNGVDDEQLHDPDELSIISSLISDPVMLMNDYDRGRPSPSGMAPPPPSSAALRAQDPPYAAAAFHRDRGGVGPVSRGDGGRRDTGQRRYDGGGVPPTGAGGEFIGRAAADGHGLPPDHHLLSRGGGGRHYHSPLEPYQELPPEPRRDPPRQSSGLIIEPDLLVLDLRPYRTLEDAIVQVKLFLENVRNMATERGLLVKDSDKQPSLFVTLVLGEGEGRQNAVLRTVLKRIFDNREIQFTDSHDGGSLLVDALSGVEDEHIPPVKTVAVPLPDDDDDRRRLVKEPSEITEPAYEIATHRGGAHSEITEPMYDHPALPFNVTTAAEDEDARRRRQAMLLMQAELPGQSPSSRHDMARDSPPFLSALNPHSRDHEAGMIVPSNHMVGPEDRGAGTLYNPSIPQSLLHRNLSEDSPDSCESNPYYNALSGAPTALGRASQGRAGHHVVAGSGIAMQRAACPDATVDPRSPSALTMPPSGRDEGGENKKPPTLSSITADGNQIYRLRRDQEDEILLPPGSSSEAAGQRKPPPVIPAGCQIYRLQGDGQEQIILPSGSSPEEVAMRATMLAQAQPSTGGLSAMPRQQPPSRRNRYSQDRHAPSTLPASLPEEAVLPADILAQGQPSNGGDAYNLAFGCSKRIDDNDNDSVMLQAISDSQATHIAHTREQVEQDIQYRRALERASEASAMDFHRQEKRRSEGADDLDEETEERICRASREAFLEDQRRKQEAEEHQAAELEWARRQSEEALLLKYEDERRLQLAEEEMVARLLAETRAEEEEARRIEEEAVSRLLVATEAEEEEARRNEEDTLRLAMQRSLAAAVDEEELVEEAIRNSISESACRSSQDGDVLQEEMMERVLKLSLEERERLDPEEEEALRRAMEWSVMEEEDNLNGAAAPTMSADEWAVLGEGSEAMSNDEESRRRRPPPRMKSDDWTTLEARHETGNELASSGRKTSKGGDEPDLAGGKSEEDYQEMLVEKCNGQGEEDSVHSRHYWR